MAEQVIRVYILKTDQFKAAINDIQKEFGETNQDAKKATDTAEKGFKEGTVAAKQMDKAVNQTNKGLRTTQTEARKTDQQFTKLTSSVKTLGAAIGLAFGVQQVIQFTKESIKAALEAEKVEKLLLGSLNGRRDIQQRLLKQASELQKVSIYGDELIVSQQTFLANQGRTEEQINKTIQAAAELSAVTGDDLATSVQKLDQTFEGSIGRLGKLDAGFKSLTKEQLANGGALDFIIEKYGGSAARAAETYEGKIIQLQNAFGDFQEKIGLELLPSLDKLAQVFKEGVEADYSEVFRELGETFSILSEATKTSFSAFETLGNALGGTSDKTKQAAGFIDLLNVALKIVTLPTRLLADAFKFVAEVVADVITFFKDLRTEGGVLSGVIDSVGSAVSGLYNGFRDLLGLQKEAPGAFGKVSESVTNVTKAIKDKTKATNEDNESDKTKITLLQRLQAELKAINDRIADTVLKGGIVSQKDVTRAAELEKILRELPLLINAAKTGVPEIVPDLGLSEDDLKTLEANLQRGTEIRNEAAERDLQNANDYLERKFNAELDYNLEREQLELEYQRFLQQQREAQINGAFAVADGVLSAFSSMFSALAEDNEEFAEFQKALAILDVSLKAAQAISAATASAASGDPYTVAIRIAAAVAAVGAAIGTIVQTVKSAQVPTAPAFAKGTEFVQRGNNKPGIDTIPAYLNEGEAVIPTDKNKQYPGLAKAWIGGKLESYVNNVMLAPKLAEIERKAEERLLSKVLSVNTEKYDDMRLYMAATEGNMYLSALLKETKRKRKKRTL